MASSSVVPTAPPAYSTSDLFFKSCKEAADALICARRQRQKTTSSEFDKHSDSVESSADKSSSGKASVKSVVMPAPSIDNAAHLVDSSKDLSMPVSTESS